VRWLDTALVLSFFAARAHANKKEKKERKKEKKRKKEKRRKERKEKKRKKESGVKPPHSKELRGSPNSSKKVSPKKRYRDTMAGG
jgi:sortase (surface protein transpeptidase)